MQFKEVYKILVENQERERIEVLEKHLREIKFLVFKEGDCLQENGTTNFFLIVDWIMDNRYPMSAQIPVAYYTGYDLRSNGEVDRSKLKRLDASIAKSRFSKVEPENNLNIGFTYLLRIADTNFYKVGMAMDVEARVAGLQMGSPFDISIVAVKENLNPRKLEKTIHLKYKENRKRGEWFEFTQREVDVLIEEFFT